MCLRRIKKCHYFDLMQVFDFLEGQNFIFVFPDLMNYGKILWMQHFEWNSWIVLLKISEF